jgi:hypothetical protein
MGARRNVRNRVSAVEAKPSIERAATGAAQNAFSGAPLR